MLAKSSVAFSFNEVITSVGKILAFIFIVLLIVVMGNSQQAAGAESTGSLLDAVRSFDKNRVEQLSQKPDWKISLLETDAEGNGPLHIIAKVGHYKYPPAGIPKLLIDSGVDVNAKNYSGVTALEISLLTGWQKVGCHSVHAESI